MTESSPEKGGTIAWTEDAKTEFLLRIIAHLKDKKPINWKEINMRGRNVKSLQNRWTIVNKALAELEENGDEPMTPTKPTLKKATPAKRKSAANEEEGQSDDAAEPAKKSPKKRGKAVAKKVKEEEEKADPGPEVKTEVKEEQDNDIREI